jgi:hypothetical protein
MPVPGRVSPRDLMTPQHFPTAPALSRPLVLGITIAVCAESVGAHALIYRRSPLASLVVLVLNIATIWWLVREARAPSGVAIEGEQLVVRHGRSVTMHIPLAQVQAVRAASWQSVPQQGTAGYLPLVGGDDPNVLLELQPPFSARLTFGIRKTVSLLGLRLEEPGQFIDAAQAARAAHGERRGA